MDKLRTECLQLTGDRITKFKCKFLFPEKIKKNTQLHFPTDKSNVDIPAASTRQTGLMETVSDNWGEN